MSDPVVLLSTGDVVGPAGGVTDNSMVLFSGTSGKLIKGNNAVVTAAGLALLDDVNAGAQRATLGLGTAATANVTTSATATTAGRLMKVGDFGLGAASAPAITNANLPVGTGSGIYALYTPFTNAPAATPCILIHQSYSGAMAQTAIEQGTSNNRMWIRQYNGSAWLPWGEIALINSPAFTGIPTAPTASAGTDTTQLATTAFVKATGDARYAQRSNNLSDLPNAATARTNLGVDAVIAALPFTKGFTSSEQVITLAGSLTIAHSLSTSPKLLAGEYVCKTAEHGYSIGDVLATGLYGDSSSTIGVGTSVVRDATNLYVRFGSAQPVIINKTTGASAAITPGNWRLVLRAWA